MFPNNSRANFITHFDKNELTSFDNKQEISAAVKSVTFENKFNLCSVEYGKPNFIIIQNYQPNPLLRYEGSFDVVLNVDIFSGKDYYFTHYSDAAYAEGKNFNLRNFTDVKLFCQIENSPQWSNRLPLNDFIIHNIYLHDTYFTSEKEFLSYLNNVYLNIEYDLPYGEENDPDPLFKIHTDGSSIILNKNKLNLDVFLSKELNSILGFTDNDLTKHKHSSLKQMLSAHFSTKILNDRYEYRTTELESFSKNPNINNYLDMCFPNNFIYSTLKVYHKENIQEIKSSNTMNLTNTTPEILGLRTNLSRPDIFKNLTYDTQVEFFNVRDNSQGVQIHEVKRPIFFPTNLDLISNAKFELIDVNTGKCPNFTTGTPTYIQLNVKTESKMNQSFNIFLDSSDEASHEYFPTNKPADFTIKFPERLEFNQEWEVALKNIFIGNNIFNIYRKSCWIKINIIKLRNIYDPSDEIIEDFFLQLEDGRYDNIKTLCLHLQNLINIEGLKLKIDLKDGYIRFKCTENKTKNVFRRYTVMISPHLSSILGTDRIVDTIHKIEFANTTKYLAIYPPNISLLTPTNFIILCDVVSETVFGAQSIKMIKFLSKNFESEKDIMDFSFYEDEFVNLNIKEFSSMRIRIADTTGDLIKSNQKVPTRCKIQFKKKSI